MSDYRYYRTRDLAEPLTWRIDQIDGKVEVWAKVMKTREDRQADRRGEPRMEWAKSGYDSLDHINRNIPRGHAGFAVRIGEEQL